MAFAISGCNPGIVQPPQVSVTDVSQYFFQNSNASASPIVFEDSNLTYKTGTTITLNFDQSNSASSFFIKESNPSVLDSLNCSLATGAVSISGITTHSIIPLPSNFSIQSRRDSALVLIPFPIHHIIASSNIVVASNDSLGIFYSSNKGQSWSVAAKTLFSRTNFVTAFTLWGSNIFAGTSSGNLYYTSIADGSTWTQAPKSQYGAIIALAASSNALYVTDGSHIYRTGNIANPGVLLSPNPSYTVTSLALSDSTINTKEIIVAGTDGGVYYRTLDSDWNRALIDVASIREVISTPNGNFYCSTMYDSVNYGIYSSLNGLRATWVKRDTLPDAVLAFDGTNIIAATTSGVVHTMNNNTNFVINPGVLQTGIYDLSASGNNYFAATSQGVYVSTDNGKGWDLFSNGISTSHFTYSESPGDIILLHATGSSFDSSWAACTMLNYQSKVLFGITGRILGHLDSLAIGGKTYADIIEVQYANEIAGAVNTLVPYLQIFYSKNEGPVLIYQYPVSTSATKPSQKIFRLK